MNRIVGLETEYGCLTNDPSGPPSAVGRVRNWIFEKNRFGLADMHQRDWDEPAGNGGFLFNGGRAYVDMGHLEYCTPECLSLIDLLRYDRAGDAILLQALKEMHLYEQVSFIRNNVDHYSGATFGCHENYLVRRSAPLTEGNVLALLSFLTLRLLFAGSGRVGSTPGAELRGDLLRPGANFGDGIPRPTWCCGSGKRYSPRWPRHATFSSAKWTGSPSVGCSGNSWNGRTSVGAILGSKRRIWSFTTWTPLEIWASHSPGRRWPGTFPRRK